MQYLVRVSCFLMAVTLISLGASAEFIALQPNAVSSDATSIEFTQDADGITLSASFPGVNLTTIDRPAGQFEQLDITGCGRHGEAGEPELPFRGVFLEVPPGVSLTISENSRSEFPFALTHSVFPAQPPMPECGSNRDPFDITVKEKAYLNDAFLPAASAQISQDGFIRGRRVIFLEIHPIQYNPVLNALRIAPDLDIRISFSGDVDRELLSDRARLSSPAFERQLSMLLLNYSALPDRGNRPDRDGADYLIITYDAFAEELAPLVEWKTLMGYQTQLTTLTQVGGTTSAAIQSYLQNAYNTWNPVPTYVLLVGDVNRLVCTTVSPDAYGSPFPSDLPYSLLQGSDYFPDVFTGRISVQTEAQCTDVVNKIISYDRNPPIANWYNTALIAAYLQDDYSPYCEADRWFFETGTYVMDYLENEAGMSIQHAMCTGASGCSTYHFRSDSYPHRPAHPDPIPSDWTALFRSTSQATAAITSAINGGVGMVQHRDHGEELGWGDPPYSVTNVNALANGNKTPVVFSTNCLTGAIDHSSDCFAEAFQKKQSGGAVGVMAATRVSYSGHNDLLTHGMFTCFYPSYDTTHTGNRYENSMNVCEAMAFGKYYMHMYEGNSAETLYTFRLFHWFGDPSMILRTNTPIAPTIDIPATIPAGTESIDITIADEGALVALSQEGTILGKGIASSGMVHIVLNQPVEAGIDVSLVVTGYNLDPLEVNVLSEAPSCGIVQFTAAGANCNSDVIVRVMDADLNQNPGAPEQVSIQVISSSNPAGIQIICTEIASDIGIFEGQFTTFSGGGAGDLLTADGDVLTARYQDAACEGSPILVEDSVGVDCIGPAITDVVITDVGIDSAVVSWTTNEPSVSRIYYGITLPPQTELNDMELKTSHTLTVEGIDPCTLIYVAVGATDASGNDSYNDNSGVFFHFITLEQFVMLQEPLDVNPGWTVEGAWAFGVPTGQGGEYGSPDPTSGHTGTNVFGYNLNGDYANSMSTTNYLTTSVFDCSTAADVTLSFYGWLGVETSTYDHATVQVSGNGGSTWQTVWSNSATMEGGSWSLWTLDISATAAGSSTVKVRWGMGPTDSGWTYCGWNIDDIMVDFVAPCGQPTPTPPPTIPPTFTPTPRATYTPVATFTPTPTVPATSTPTIPATSTPSATPTPDLQHGMTLTLSDPILSSGDVFDLRFALFNDSMQTATWDAFVVLDVYGHCWFWPSWKDMNAGLDKTSYLIHGGEKRFETVLQFEWPAGVGSAGDLKFYGAVFTENTWNLIGTLQMIEWSYE